MSNIKMPKPNEALREFFQNDEVFASLFNGYFFHGEKVISPTALKPADTAYAVTVQNTAGKKQKINKYRDIVRKTEIGTLVILGIEDQNKVHYDNCNTYYYSRILYGGNPMGWTDFPL